MLGLVTVTATEQRLARALALQRALVDGTRSLDAGQPLAHVLGTVLDEVVGPDRGLRAVVLAHDEGRARVLARYPAGGAPAGPSPAEESLAQQLLASDAAIHRSELLVGDDGTEQAPVRVHRLGLTLTVGGRPGGALLFEVEEQQGFSEDDRLVLEGVSLIAGAALAASWRSHEQRELERLRSDFISRVSHELRTPLTIINGFAGTMAAHDETLTERQRHEMLDRIITATVRLEHLVDDVLSLASVDAGTREPSPADVPVRDVIDLTVHDQGGNGQVEVDCPASLRLHTDPTIARQVLGPVVLNALQHGQRVHVEAREDTDGIRIVVSDDGPGVPGELGERVFDRFVRGDDREPGMGLGLALARSAGAVIGARLALEPSEVGARFVVSLPDLMATTG